MPTWSRHPRVGSMVAGLVLVASQVVVAQSLPAGQASGSPASSGAPSSPALPSVAPGRTVTSADGRLTLELPPDVAAGFQPTIEPLADVSLPSDVPVTAIAGAAYELGPSGTTFVTPVTVTLRLPAIAADAPVPLDVLITQDGTGAWVPLGDLTVTPTTDGLGLSGTTTHFSPIVAASGSGALTLDPAAATRAVGDTADASVHYSGTSNGIVGAVATTRIVKFELSGPHKTIGSHVLQVTSTDATYRFDCLELGTFGFWLELTLSLPLSDRPWDVNEYLSFTLTCVDAKAWEAYLGEALDAIFGVPIPDTCVEQPPFTRAPDGKAPAAPFVWPAIVSICVGTVEGSFTADPFSQLCRELQGALVLCGARLTSNGGGSVGDRGAVGHAAAGAARLDLRADRPGRAALAAAAVPAAGHAKAGAGVTFILITLDHPFDPIEPTDGVYVGPILDIRAAGTKGSGAKARPGFPFDTIQGSTSFLKAGTDASGWVFNEVVTRTFDVAPADAVVAYGGTWVLWVLPERRGAKYLPVLEESALVNGQSTLAMSTASLSGADPSKSRGHLSRLYFEPPTIAQPSAGP